MPTALTTSERLFAEYCEARQYRAEQIPAGPDIGRSPDYKVHTPAGPVIVEIKELAPNDEDRRLAAEFDADGTTSYIRTPGARVRRAIMDAAPQLKRYRDSVFPEILLLYDNTARLSLLGDYLDPLDLSSGMFGEAVIRFRRDNSKIPVGTSSARHGRGQQMTKRSRLYIGAVAVMKRNTKNGLYLDFYHNPFSNKPLWPRYFLNSNDRHYIKGDHPNAAGWEWNVFVGDRRST